MANGDRVQRVDSERPKRVTCHRCRLYDRERRRCRLGKVNPRSKLETYETAQVLGVRALCAFNLYREQLLGGSPAALPASPSLLSTGDRHR